MYYPMITYATHLVVGLALVLRAGRMLFPNGFEPPADGTNGRSGLAGAIRQTLVPGFYGANFVSIALNFETGLIRPTSLVETVLALGAKVGATVIVLAATCLLAGAVIRALCGSRSGHARPPRTNEEPS